MWRNRKGDIDVNSLRDYFTAELLGSPPDLANRLWVNALVDSVSSTEDQVAKTRTTIGKFRLILSDLYRMMFPLQEVPPC